MKRIGFFFLCWMALCSFSTVYGAPPAKAVGCKPLYGITYDPFAVSTKSICLSKEQVVIDVQIMATLSKSIRLYSIATCPETTLALLSEAKVQNMAVVLGLFIGGNAQANEKEIGMLSRVMKTYSGVVQSIVVGTDALVSGKIESTSRYSKILSNTEILLEYIGRVRDIMNRNGWKHPITTAEGWGVWESEYGATLAEAVDFICLKINPFTEGIGVSCTKDSPNNCIGAAEYANARATGLSKFYSKSVWICETSWPTDGNNCCFGIPSKKSGYKAIASPDAATQYLSEFVDLVGNRPYFISSAFDRDWRRIWSPCPQCAEKNLALSSFKNGICDLCDQDYSLGLFDQYRQRKVDYELPDHKCSLPSLPSIRLAATTATPPKPPTSSSKSPSEPKSSSKKKPSTKESSEEDSKTTKPKTKPTKDEDTKKSKKTTSENTKTSKKVSMKSVAPKKTESKTQSKASSKTSKSKSDSKKSSKS